jgi:hypothetical protein
MFIKHDNTKWINKLKTVVTTYNNSKHSSLGGLTPNQAGEEKHFNHIHELNQIKRSYNQTVSDLKVGNLVRKNIAKTFSKGTEPKWSDEVFIVKAIRGNKIELNDDTIKLGNNLLHVPDGTESTNTNVIQKAKENKYI